VGNWFPPAGQALPNGLITGASILAYAVVHPVFGGLIDRVDWPTAFLITGTLTGLLTIAWLLCARDYPPQSEASAPVEHAVAKAEPWSKGTRRDLVFLTLAYSAVGYFQYLFFYWMHFYFDSILHMEKAESRYFAGLPNLAMAACMPLGGWLADRVARWRNDPAAATLVPKVGMPLSAVLLGCGIFAQDRFWIVTLFTASLGILGLCEATFWTAAVKLGGARGGTSAAIMNTGGNGIGLLAPMVTPWLGSHLGWEWGLGAGAVVGALGGLCWFAVGRRP
jgi:MFS family permease